jgi:hypothetical protein
VDEYRRALAVLTAVDDMLRELRSRHDPALEEHIETLEGMQGDLLTRIERLHPERADER